MPHEEISRYGLEQTNVLLLTLDSCRADSVEAANMPYLKSLGMFSTAQTPGLFTLPAHTAFFNGYLPIDQSSREPYVNPNIRQLWRMKDGRSRDPSTVGIMLEGQNVIDGYRKLGFQTLGFGGTRWFRNNMLTSPFDEFGFYGPGIETSVFTERKPEELVLNHRDEILARFNPSRKHFLFINCIETHAPYDSGNGEELTAQQKDIMDRGQKIWGCKTLSFDKIDVTEEELASLQNLQILALEVIDHKIEDLISRMPKPLLVVIAGDHGECFGENLFWGHGYTHRKVSEVPLLIATLEA